jgi:cellulose synthase/poly-beta-1,6-N-acetylglucosamine synthase-like glycosyltransferase
MSLSTILSGLAGGLLGAAGIVVVSFFVMVHTAVAALLVSALPELWRQWDLADDEALAPILESEALPTVSVVVTGRADRAWTAATLRSLLALRYPRHEVVLVHDGAESGFLRTLIEHFDLYQVPPAILVNVPTGAARGYYRSRRHGKLFVIDKPHVGHADDLNAALNASRFPYVLTMNVNTRLEPHALTRLMRPFLVGEPVASVAGTTRVGWAGHPAGDPGVIRGVPFGWLGGVLAVEHLREKVFARLGWNRFGGQLPDQGSVLLHRREQLLELDGYRAGVTDPERDLVMRLRARLRGRLATAVPALPDAVAWTLAPERLQSIARDRSAIHRGRIEELLTWRAVAATDTGDGATGNRAAAALAALAVAPVMELLGYVLLALALFRGGMSDPFVPVFLLAVPGYALLLSLWAVALEWASAGTLHSWRDAARLGVFAVVEQFGYRQRIMWARLGAVGAAMLRRPRGDAGRLTPAPTAADVRGAADQLRAR